MYIGTVGIALNRGSGTLGLTGVTVNAAAGTSSQAPIVLTSGTNLTTPVAGAIEFDGSNYYITPNTTTGRAGMDGTWTYRMTGTGTTTVQATIADYFPATSSINLEASSVYEIEMFCYFTKTTAGTVTWTMAASSAPTLMTGWYQSNPVASVVTAGATTNGWAGGQGAATAAFAASGSLATGVNHAFHFKITIITSAATNFRMRITSNTGTTTHLAGSWYSVNKVNSTTGNFAA